MLLRAVTYRHEPLESHGAARAGGGSQGVMPVAVTAPQNQYRRSRRHDQERDHQQQAGPARPRLGRLTKLAGGYPVRGLDEPRRAAHQRQEHHGRDDAGRRHRQRGAPVETDGDREQEAMDAILALIDDKFGEDENWLPCRPPLDDDLRHPRHWRWPAASPSAAVLVASAGWRWCTTSSSRIRCSELGAPGAPRDAVVVQELQRMQREMPARRRRAGRAARRAPDAAAGRPARRRRAPVDQERLYNAEWALISQLEVLSRQFDEMEDAYLRERKADLEQVVERVLRHLKGAPLPPWRRPPRAPAPLLLDDTQDVPLVLVAHDLSPADMLQFKKSVFAGFVTDVGGKTSHTAIVARSMDILAVVGARWPATWCARTTGHHRRRRRRDDRRPSPIILAEYASKQRQASWSAAAWRA